MPSHHSSMLPKYQSVKSLCRSICLRAAAPYTMPGVEPFSSQAPRAKRTPSSIFPSKGSHCHAASSPSPTVSMWLSSMILMGPLPMRPRMLPILSKRTSSKPSFSISCPMRSPTSLIWESMEGMRQMSRRKVTMSSR